MAKIKVTQKQIEFESNPEKTLMENLIGNNLPVASSCQGDGICGLCYVIVEVGGQNLPAPSEAEKKLLAKKDYPQNYRLSCYLHPEKDLSVKTLYW